MRKVFYYILCLSLAAGLSCAPSIKEQKNFLNWRPLAEGKVEAREKGMPILIDFYFGEGCHRCMVLDREVYNNQQIAELINRDFVPVRIDLSKTLTADEKALEDNFATGGECLLGFLDKNGKLVKTQKGKNLCTMNMISREEFITYLEHAKKRIGE